MRDTFNSSNAETLSPIIFYYFDINGTDAFIRMLEERFRQTGSRRPIVFREWDCYETLPGEDGDLFAYDGVVLYQRLHAGEIVQAGAPLYDVDIKESQDLISVIFVPALTGPAGFSSAAAFFLLAHSLLYGSSMLKQSWMCRGVRMPLSFL